MALDVTIDGGVLSIDLSGWHCFFSMHRHVEIPLDAIESVTLQSKHPLVGEVAVRMRGSSIPGRVLAGSYSVWPHARVEKGDRQFWMTYSQEEVLVIDTTIPRPRRIVLEPEERHELMLRIQDAVKV